LHDKIATDIRGQVDKYLSYIDIESVIITSNDGDPYMDMHTLDITIEYRIIPLALSDTLEITTTIN